MHRIVNTLVAFVVVMLRACSIRALSFGAMSSILSTRGGAGTRSACEAAAPLKSAAVSDLGSKNPLTIKDGLPRFVDIKPADVLPAIESDLETLQSEFGDFESRMAAVAESAKYPEVIEDLEKIQFPLGTSWSIVNHLLGVRNSDELRDSHKAVQPKVISMYQRLGQSQPLFKALKTLKEKEALDEAKDRIVTSAIRQMESSGVGLEDAKREAFNKMQLEMADLQTKFSNNVLDSTKAFKLEISEKAKLEGLPASTLRLLAQQATANGHKDATPESGPWVITLDMPVYLPCMENLVNRELRETLYRAFVTRASSGEKDNAPIIKRILQIRREMAQTLGYSCHAEKSLAAKMAPSVQSVMDLTKMLREKSFSAAQRELEEVTAFANKNGHAGPLALWDVPYWSERLRESAYEFQEEDLRAYLPMPAVLQGLFQLAGRLFGITIEEAAGEAQVWSPDVKFFNIRDSESNEVIASFFLDPYSRPAEKRGGAWMDVCVGKSKVMGKKPVAYLICNGSPPVGDKPSLMTFREVETLFHEFGHGLQHMLTRVEEGDAAGINNVEWDAVELPSQFMENWCYDRPTINNFAKHYETGEPIPEELFQKIKNAKNFQAGLKMLRQLFFGSMDMQLHSSFDPSGEKTCFDVQHELAKEFTVVPPLPEDRFLCAFGHIFAGGYSAGYYSYKWAEVMSADAFEAFEEAGLDNDEAVKATGRRFRETVLAMGGAQHPSKVFESFRGRQPSPEALLRHSGLL